MVTYLQSRAAELAREDKAYNQWYASLSYLEKQNFERKMKSIMTPEEWDANPPSMKLKPDWLLAQDNEMLQMVCLGRITVKHYMRYRNPKNQKHIDIILREIHDRHKQLTGQD